VTSPVSIAGGRLERITNTRGEALPNRFSADAEAIDTIWRDGSATAVRVGFENLTRVADFDLAGARPVGAARPVSIPDWLAATRTNRSLEAVCIAGPASPIAGSTLLMVEAGDAGATTTPAYLLGRADRGPLRFRPSTGFNPTDCAFGPRGELYVLERGVGLLSFRMQVRRVEAADVQPGETLEGELILAA
jgi:hypothetical protein